jgi:hypothetical protein
MGIDIVIRIKFKVGDLIRFGFANNIDILYYAIIVRVDKHRKMYRVRFFGNRRGEPKERDIYVGLKITKLNWGL